MLKRPVVFLSSVFYEEVDGTRAKLDLRDQIIETVGADGLADLRAHSFALGSGAPEDDNANNIIDRCFKDIKACDLFVFLRTRRHGSGVAWHKNDATISTYLEMELFAAALLRKPVLILHDQGYEPEPRLADLLRVMKRTLANADYIQDEQAGLVSQLSARIKGLADDTGIPPARPMWVPDALSRLRSPGTAEHDLANPHLYFLGGLPDQGEPGGNLDRAERLIGEVLSGDTRSEASMSHGAALFRLWAATRELASYDCRDQRVAGLWDAALGMWSGRASWFGVHGHIYLGPLAAVNAQIDLRRRLAAASRSSHSREPFGARASALYSIAHQMHQRSRKVRHYAQAASEATKAVNFDPSGSGGALSVRGHALMRLALLGRPWLIFAVQADFERSLAVRRRTQASPSSIGEAETDLGLSLVMTGRLSRGFALLNEGVGLLRADLSVSGQSFLARGLRKLEQGARLTGRFGAARAAHEERMALAASIEAIDQMRP